MAEIQCPACGSHEVETSYSEQSYSAPFGPTRVFRVRTDTCRTCDESGDFVGANAPIVKAAMEEADRESIEKLLESLNETGVTAAYVERALSLPARTVARWKTSGYSASGLTLLRLVRTFPWLLEVASARFSQAVAVRSLIAAAAKTIQQVAASSGISYSVSATQPGEGICQVEAVFTQANFRTRTAMPETPGSATLTETRGAA